MTPGIFCGLVLATALGVFVDPLLFILTGPIAVVLGVGGEGVWDRWSEERRSRNHEKHLL